MKAMGRMIMDLHLDILKYIMILVATSSDGAANIARAISVCSQFLKVGKDTDVLKAVCFQNVSISDRYGLFQRKGLLYRCAQVGNEAAQYLIAKVILLSSSQLSDRGMKRGLIETSSRGCSQAYKACHGKIPMDNSLVANFMDHFGPDQACSANESDQTVSHWELVRKFLRHCSAQDFAEMHPHLDFYVAYLWGFKYPGNLVLHSVTNGTCVYRLRVRAPERLTLEDIRRLTESYINTIGRLGELKRSRQSNQGLFQ